MASHNNLPLAAWAAQEVVDILSEELGVRDDDLIVDNLLSKRFATAKHGCSWLSAFSRSDSPLSLALAHDDGGFSVTLYPIQGRQVSLAHRQARSSAQARLDDLWARHNEPAGRWPLLARPIAGPRSRLSPLACRAA